MAGTGVRKVCLKVLKDWDDGSVYAEDLISAAGGRLTGRDRALLRTLVFGVLRNLSLLDYWVQAFRSGKTDRMTQWILRLGLYQLLMTRVRDHAAVNETVGLARKSARAVVNAVLRRAIRERDSLLGELDSLEPGIRYSMPEFLIERWVRQFGRESTLKICEWAQEPAPVYIRRNLLKPEGEQAFADAQTLKPIAEEGFYLADPAPANLLESGVGYIQDPSTVRACRLLAPKPGNSVLDACAAPGGKTAVLAQLMNNEGSIAATDPSPKRLQRLEHNLARLGVSIAKCHRWQWGEDAADREGDAPFGPAGFDRVLVDVPCSNTGVLRRRVDARWRLHPDTFVELQGRQVAITLDCMSHVRPGGSLVYSTCSLEEEENRGVVDLLLAQADGWELKEELVTLPHVDGFDGAYAALLKRR